MGFGWSFGLSLKAIHGDPPRHGCRCQTLLVSKNEGFVARSFHENEPGLLGKNGVKPSTTHTRSHIHDEEPGWKAPDEQGPLQSIQLDDILPPN